MEPCCGYLSRPDVPYRGNVKEAVLDVFAIAKGIVDAAGEREETDARQLEKRVRRAVYGYLGFNPRRHIPGVTLRLKERLSAVIRKSTLNGDVGKGQAGIRHKISGPIHAAFNQPLIRRAAKGLFEGPSKVVH